MLRRPSHLFRTERHRAGLIYAILTRRLLDASRLVACSSTIMPPLAATPRARFSRRRDVLLHHTRPADSYGFRCQEGARTSAFPSIVGTSKPDRRGDGLICDDGRSN